MSDIKNLERRPWTPQEDKALKKIYEALRINKWSFIAQELQQKHGFAGRTGKQCRQRYNNHLDPSLCRDEWSFQQQKKLYKLHDNLGNKWAVISNKLGPGRTDNNVKNHFFSRLRKSLRKINKIIHQQYKKQFRIIQTKVLYKIIEASEQKFKAQPMCEIQVIQYSTLLKNKIIMFSYEDSDIEGRQIIEEILQFNKNYKRKPKKFRKVGGTYPELAQKIDYNKKFNEIHDFFRQNIAFRSLQKNQSQQQQQQSNEYQGFQKESGNNSLRIQTHQQKIISPIILTSSHRKILQPKLTQAKQQQQQKKRGNNQQILQALGLLEDDAQNPHPMFMKKQLSVSYASSQYPQQSQQFKFFDDSSMQIRIPTGNMPSMLKKQSIDQKLFQ